jgi:tRNA(Ile)-lysidine synthase
LPARYKNNLLDEKMYSIMKKCIFAFMLKQFQKHIDANLPFLKENKLLLAISGGKDSVSLAFLLKELGFDVAFAHCNFQLRADASDADEIFVMNLAKKMNLEVYIKHFETEKYAKNNGISIQMAARDLRYTWFDALAEEKHFDYILTAHHQDDVLETFLLNLVRGTGLKGLTGIPEKNGKIVRPLLPFSRAEISQYCLDNAISWREDTSNASTKYSRNKLRHDVIPVLKSMNPNLMISFQNTLKHLKSSQSIINTTVENLKNDTDFFTKKNGIITFPIVNWLKLPNYKALFYEVLMPYGFTAWDDIFNLFKAQSGTAIFSSTHRLLKDRKMLFLTKNNVVSTNDFFLIDENDKSLELTNSQWKLETINNSDEILEKYKNIALIDKKMLKFPLEVRIWQKGDYFYPLGMQGKKKISKFYKDEKLSLLEKEKTYLLVSNENIVWVEGKRLDKRFKITAQTEEIYKITRINS